MTGNTATKTRLRIALHAAQDGKCHLCGLEIDMSITDPTDNRAATLDHINPRALGGTGRKENMALAHRFCNRSRGVKPVLHSHPNP